MYIYICNNKQNVRTNIHVANKHKVAIYPHSHRLTLKDVAATRVICLCPPPPPPQALLYNN